MASFILYGAAAIGKIDHDRRYDRFPDVVVPRGESLKMAYDRIVPY